MKALENMICWFSLKKSIAGREQKESQENDIDNEQKQLGPKKN